MKLGQIKRTDQLGNILYQYAKSDKINTIVEIGTWNGMGSTKCIIDGLLERENDNYKFFTIELYPDMFEEACVNLQPYIDKGLKIELLNGKIIEFVDAFWFNHNIINPEKDRHAELWYEKDMEYLQSGKNVLDKLPDDIDLLVLDGGEYTTYPEYKLLKNRTKIIALDDTNVLKCKQIREELISERHKLLYDNLFERNGVAVFELTRINTI